MIKDLIRCMRPKQWTKNTLVFASLLFEGALFEKEKVLDAAVIFFSFCLASSAVYLFNDIIDRKRDALNPKKAARPIASGKLRVPVAVAFYIALVAGSLFLAKTLYFPTLLIVTAYIIINIFYSLGLKNFPLIDVFIIAAGFVLRLISGAFATGAAMTTWFLLCVLFLALFLALGKRRGELLEVGGGTTRAATIYLKREKSLNIIH